jgi:hypothetical protein
MGTRSRIAIENADGTVESIYCHWDGYPEHNGELLLENYQDEPKVRALIALGDLSSLDKRVAPEPTEVHSFDNKADGVCVAYGRDRGEEDVGKKTHANIGELLDHCGEAWEEWVYIYRNGQWVGSAAGYDEQSLQYLSDLVSRRQQVA